MNAKLLIGFSVTLIFMACATPHKVTKQINNLEGDWVLAVFMPEQKKTLAEVFGNRIAELQFNKATNGVAGTTGCNRFAGTFTADTSHLRFSENRAVTKMACEGYDEQTFLNTLDRVNRYRLGEGQLELLQDTTILMVFARKPPTK